MNWTILAEQARLMGVPWLPLNGMPGFPMVGAVLPEPANDGCYFEPGAA